MDASKKQKWEISGVKAGKINRSEKGIRKTDLLVEESQPKEKRLDRRRCGRTEEERKEGQERKRARVKEEEARKRGR